MVSRKIEIVVTIEHIYSLYTIVNNRKRSKLSTYVVCFIDLKKAFDTVSRDLQGYKLMCIGITGRILDAIQSLYVNVQCTVRINELWLCSRTSLKTEYESSMAVVYCYSVAVGLKSE